MKIAIIGSREFNDYSLLEETMTELSTTNFPPTHIVSGGAKGADTLGEKWANENNIETIIFLPDWSKYGKQAGFIRNVDIIKNSDFIVAFWDGESKGTLHSINLTEKQNKPIKIINYEKTKNTQRVQTK